MESKDHLENNQERSFIKKYIFLDLSMFHSYILNDTQNENLHFTKLPCLYLYTLNFKNHNCRHEG